MATDTRWSDDAFLDRLRAEGDAAADACLRALGDSQNFSEIFRFLNANDAPIPASAPDALRQFLVSYDRLPVPDGSGVDHARLQRGEEVFMTHACTSALCLLAMSLPAGYAAPNLAQVLVMSGDLKKHPYTRLLGVLQMVVNVTSPRGFEPGGKAIVTAAKLRLLHAGVRQLVRRRLPEYEGRYGMPVNHEDMLATIMGFSLLVIRGLQSLRVGLTHGEAADYYYLWRTFALTMGIHPPGSPNSTEYLPETLADAEAFFASYARRHYRDAAVNAEGVELTRASVMMLDRMVHDTPLRWLGGHLLPRVYMQQLLGADGLRQRGVTPLRGHAIVRAWLMFVVRVWSALGTRVDQRYGTHLHERLSQRLFRYLIKRTMRGEVTFLIPEQLSDLHALTDPIIRPFGERRRGPRRARQVGVDTDRRQQPDRRLAFRASFWGNGSTR